MSKVGRNSIGSQKSVEVLSKGEERQVEGGRQTGLLNSRQVSLTKSSPTLGQRINTSLNPEAESASPKEKLFSAPRSSRHDRASTASSSSSSSSSLSSSSSRISSSSSETADLLSSSSSASDLSQKSRLSESPLVVHHEAAPISISDRAKNKVEEVFQSLQNRLQPLSTKLQDYTKMLKDLGAQGRAKFTSIGHQAAETLERAKATPVAQAMARTGQRISNQVGNLKHKTEVQIATWNAQIRATAAAAAVQGAKEYIRATPNRMLLAINKNQSQLACEIGIDPFALMPKKWRDNPQVAEAIPEHKNFVRVARNVTQDYRKSQAKAIGASAVCGVISGGMATALVSSFGAILGLLIAKKEASLRASELGQSSGEAPIAPESMADLDVTDLSGFGDLEKLDPELGQAMNNILDSFGPADSNLDVVENARANFIQDFKEAYNQVPAEERHEFLEQFSQEAAQGLMRALENNHNIAALGEDAIYLSSDVADKITDEAMKSAIASASELGEAQAAEMADYENRLKDNSASMARTISNGARNGAAYGAIFGGVLGGGLLFSSIYQSQQKIKKFASPGGDASPLRGQERVSESSQRHALSPVSDQLKRLHENAGALRKRSKELKQMAKNSFENQIERPINRQLAQENARAKEKPQRS